MKATKCEIPCYSPEVPTCPCDHAYARGWKDGEGDQKLVLAGIKGPFQEDNYPSNPFHKSDPCWTAYNTGWFDVQHGAGEFLG